MAGIILCFNGLLLCSLTKTGSPFMQVMFIWERNIDLGSDNFYSVCSPRNTGTFCSVFTCAGNRGTFSRLLTAHETRVHYTVYLFFQQTQVNSTVCLFVHETMSLFDCPQNRGTLYIVLVCLHTKQRYILHCACLFSSPWNRYILHSVCSPKKQRYILNCVCLPTEHGKKWPRNNTK